MLEFEPCKAYRGLPASAYTQPAFLGKPGPASIRKNANDPHSNSPIAQNRINSTGDHWESNPAQSSRQWAGVRFRFICPVAWKTNNQSARLVLYLYGDRLLTLMSPVVGEKNDDIRV